MLFWRGRSLWRSLWREQSGATAMIYGLLLVPLLGMIGLSVDSARAFAVRLQLQHALDAAALAGGRMYGFPGRDQKIQDYFNANWSNGVYGAASSPLIISDNPALRELTVRASATVGPVFVKFLGVTNVVVGAEAHVIDSDTTLEVALAIDTTGSMSGTDSQGNVKIQAAKTAATELLDILFAGQASDARLFVSVVPFVQNVNVGSNYSSWLVAGSEAAVPWNSGPYPSSGWKGCMFERLNAGGNVIYDTTEEPPTVQKFMPYADSYLKPTCANWSSGMAVTDGQCVYNSDSGVRRYYEVNTTGTTGANAPTHSSGTQSYNGISFSAYTVGGTAPRRWVTGESFGNTGNYRLNDDWFFAYDNRSTGTTTGATPPQNTSGTVTSGSISWRYRSKLTQQDPYYASTSQYGYGYNTGCGSAIVPLSNTRATVQNTVDSLQASVNYGGTMTSMGLIWAWRTISERWKGLWAGVPADRPADYSSAENYKAIIILTDGENVFQSCSNMFCKAYATPYGYLPDGRLGTTVSSQAVDAIDNKVTEICDHARAAGVRIYSVMFDLPSGASGTRTLFQGCVGHDHPERFFDVTNGDDLQQAFQAIAVDLTRLRISQ